MKVLSLDGLTHAISKVKAWVTDNFSTKTELDEQLSGVAKLTSPNNLLHNGNEFTFIPAGHSGELYINYRTASGACDGKISNYHFCGGDGSETTLMANYFKGKFQGDDARPIYNNSEVAMLSDIPSINSVSITQTVHKHTTTATGIVTYSVPNFNSSTMALDVYVNGLYCIPTVDYTLSDNVVTLTNELETGQTCAFVVRSVTL